MKSQSLARAASVSTPSLRQERLPPGPCPFLVRRWGRAIYACKATGRFVRGPWRFLACRQEGRRTDGTCLPRVHGRSQRSRWQDSGLLADGLESSTPFQGTSPRRIALAPQKEVRLGGKHPSLGARRPGSLPQPPGRLFIPEPGSQFHLMWSTRLEPLKEGVSQRGSGPKFWSQAASLYSIAV